MLAARQLAWWVSQLQYAALEACFGLLLPLVLACMDDPSAPVQCMGLHAFQHLAEGTSSIAVRFQTKFQDQHALQLACQSQPY